MKQTCRFTLLLAALSLAASASFASDGRTEISQDMIPYQIDAPGSYVVTENLFGDASENGITINEDNISIDLNGFSVVGVTNSFNGIVATTGRKNVTIKDGSVRGWGDDGIDLQTVTNCQILNVRLTGNSQDGLLTGEAGTIVECTAIGNRNGIIAGSGSVLTRCVARENGGDGFQSTTATIFSHCVSRENNGDGFQADTSASIIACNARSNDDDGIKVGDGSHVSDSVAYQNDNGINLTGSGASAIRCTVYGNRINGILANTANSIFQCNGYDNADAGIRVTDDSYLLDNLFVSTSSATEADIYVDGDGNRIEKNHVVDGLNGYKVTGVDNLLVRNTENDASTAYSVTNGNYSGATSTAPATAGPWDNFNY